MPICIQPYLQLSLQPWFSPLPHTVSSLDWCLLLTEGRFGKGFWVCRLLHSLSLSFAASDLIWLVHKSPQGLSWVACGQPELKLRVGLLPQFHWKCLWMAAVLCAVFGVANLEGSPHTLSKVKCYQESKSKKHLASQQINGLVCHVQWQFWKTTQNPEELLFSNFSQNKTYKMAPRFSNNYLGWSLSTCAGKPLLLKRPKCNRNADISVLIISMLLT